MLESKWGKKVNKFERYTKITKKKNLMPNGKWENRCDGLAYTKDIETSTRCCSRLNFPESICGENKLFIFSARLSLSFTVFLPSFSPIRASFMTKKKKKKIKIEFSYRMSFNWVWTLISSKNKRSNWFRTCFFKQSIERFLALLFSHKIFISRENLNHCANRHKGTYSYVFEG